MRDLLAQSLHLGDRLVGVSWVGNEAATVTVGEQIEFFEDRLADENFVTENEGLFQRIAAEDLENNRPRNPDRVLTSIGVLRHALSAHANAQPLQNVWGTTQRSAPVSTRASPS